MKDVQIESASRQSQGGDFVDDRALVKVQPPIGVHGTDYSNTDLTRTTTRSFKHSVSFDKVQVHEFSQWLGDSPSCSEVPPIALSWDCVHTRVLKINDYEYNRGHWHSEQELIICVQQRINVLKWLVLGLHQ